MILSVTANSLDFFTSKCISAYSAFWNGHTTQDQRGRYFLATSASLLPLSVRALNFVPLPGHRQGMCGMTTSYFCRLNGEAIKLSPCCYMLIFRRKWEQVGETFRRCTNRGVLGAGGDDVVVEGVPLDVQHVASVAWHPRLVGVHFACLMGGT